MKVYTDSYYIPIVFLIGLLLNSSFMAKAQSGYTLIGSARPASAPDFVSLTEERPGQPQTGALWYNKVLRLTESFDVEFTVNFGNNTSGADGVTVVMQTMGNNALGGSGSGIGYRGVRPSFGIEFDTHYNGETEDPRGDHMALVHDGNNAHQFNSIFARPVPISTATNNVKDGKDHLVKISWNADSHLLQVDVDCVPRISQSVDLINNIFGGIQDVYFGLTSSTGNAGNAHIVYAPKDIIIRKTLQACPSDSLTLLAGLSLDGKYEWKPNTGLNNAYIRNPKLIATTNQVYTVSYVDRCSVLRTETVSIRINAPNLSIEGNRDACEGKLIELNAILNPPNNIAEFRWSTGDTTRQYRPKTSGIYKLQVSIGNCVVSDSSIVTFHPLPKRSSSIDSIFNCQVDSPIRLDPKVSDKNLKFLWAPNGTSESTLLATAPGRYSVRISTEFGCSVEQNFTILDNCLEVLVFVPDAFTPNGDGRNEIFEWKSNVEVEAQMEIYNRWGEIVFSSSTPGEFWDGTWNGQQCLTSAYSWKLDYRSKQSQTNKRFIKRGEVFLLR